MNQDTTSLSLTFEECQDQRVVYAGGEIDISTSPVTFIDSSGLHALVDFAVRLRKIDSHLVIRKPHSAVYRAIEVSGLLSKFVFEI